MTRAPSPRLHILLLRRRRRHATVSKSIRRWNFAEDIYLKYSSRKRTSAGFAVDATTTERIFHLFDIPMSPLPTFYFTCLRRTTMGTLKCPHFAPTFSPGHSSPKICAFHWAFTPSKGPTKGLVCTIGNAACIANSTANYRTCGDDWSICCMLAPTCALCLYAGLAGFNSSMGSVALLNIQNFFCIYNMAWR